MTISNERREVVLRDGKYTVVLEPDCRLHALRFGERWRDLTGDNLILAMMQEIEYLRDLASELNKRSIDASAELLKQFKEVQRLKFRLNHQTEDDAENCRQGRHRDCGAESCGYVSTQKPVLYCYTITEPHPNAPAMLRPRYYQTGSKLAVDDVFEMIMTSSKGPTTYKYRVVKVDGLTAEVVAI